MKIRMRLIDKRYIWLYILIGLIAAVLLILHIGKNSKSQSTWEFLDENGLTEVENIRSAYIWGKNRKESVNISTEFWDEFVSQYAYGFNHNFMVHIEDSKRFGEEAVDYILSSDPVERAKQRANSREIGHLRRGKYLQGPWNFWKLHKIMEFEIDTGKGKFVTIKIYREGYMWTSISGMRNVFCIDPEFTARYQELVERYEEAD